MIALDRLETGRLVCLRPTVDHGPGIAALLQDPRVARTLSVTGKPPTDAELAASLVEKDAHWRRHGFGLWTICDRASGEVIGRGGLQHTSVTGTDEVEVGWAFVPDRWGEGLASELGLASLEAASETLDLDEVIAYTRIDNLASRRVMEKIGMSYERELERPAGPHVVYRRRRC